jgi:hypothetical protein
MENFKDIIILLSLIYSGAAVVIIVSSYCYYLLVMNYEKKKVTYIKRTNGKTRITKDGNGNVIKVEDIRNLEK